MDFINLIPYIIAFAYAVMYGLKLEHSNLPNSDSMPPNSNPPNEFIIQAGRIPVIHTRL
jgi:hypothetical protein